MHQRIHSVFDSSEKCVCMLRAQGTHGDTVPVPDPPKTPAPWLREQASQTRAKTHSSSLQTVARLGRK